jgi:hypothetical protein
VRFKDFLHSTVLASGGAATALAVAALAGAANGEHGSVAVTCAVWWVVAAMIGAWLGRRADASPPIARLLSNARAQAALPEQQATRVVLNRLWPLAICTLGAGACAFFAPQVAGIASGFAMIWALTWRRQEHAVSAIEERDGARFYIERTSPLAAIKLIRTPGFRTRFEPLDGNYEKAGTT